jgi:hypothetical protein
MMDHAPDHHVETEKEVLTACNICGPSVHHSIRWNVEMSLETVFLIRYARGEF